MRQRIPWLLFAFTLVAALALVGVQLYATGGSETQTGGAVAGKPQYGGTISPWSSSMQNADPPSPDIAAGVYASLMWLDFIQETPLVGNIEKYGPRGNGAYKYQTYYYIPYEYLTGGLCESWEMTLDKIVFTVRPGIHWAADGVTFMKNREVTAADIAADMNAFRNSMWGSRFKGVVKDIRAEGNKVIVDVEKFTSTLLYWLSHEDRALISPPEMTQAGAGKWENQVGTGPWMFDEYVVGSHMSFKKNPNYWKTTVVDGAEYKLPFIDKVLMPIIPDVSTQMAALKTGKIDVYRGVPATQWQMLDSTATGMEKAAFSIGTGAGVALRCDLKPFNDLRVRRALMAGTNRADFAKLANAQDLVQKGWWPIVPGHPTYTPLAEFPTEVQQVWDYSPELAKKLLADAGYPNGFKTTLLVQSLPAALDEAALLKDQWAKIGVTLDLDVKDQAAFTKALNVFHPDPYPDWKGASLAGSSVNADPRSAFTITWITGGVTNYVLWSNKQFDDLMAKAATEMDLPKQNALVKEAGKILAPEFTHIPLYLIPNRNYWWPWVKNYYGESTATDDATFAAVVRFMWIDQQKKKAMGF